MSISKERRAELQVAACEMLENDAVNETGNIHPPGMTYGELRALLDMADERDRYRSKLEEARRSYLKDGTIFAREVDTALEGKE